MNNKRNNRYKSRGSILVITALAAIVWIFIAQSLFIVGAGGFGMIKSSRVALQAQQYAEIEVDRLKNVAYENLDSNGAHSRQAIANIQESGWEDEVSIGSEHAISGSDDAKQRIATINVYKSGDTLPRFTLEVPLSSQSSSLNLPVGTILPYVGKLSDIPSGWHLCDGSVGTPNLSGRFLEGTTSAPKTFKEAGLPNITGSLFPSFEASSYLPGRESGAFSSYFVPNEGASNEVPDTSSFVWSRRYDFSASRSSLVYGRSNTVQPTSYTVYYIIRVR